MPATTFDLTEENIIEQGSLWKRTFRYPANLTGARFRGQIRSSYTGDLLAEFRFSLGQFDEDEEYTPFHVLLNANQTKKIPIPAASGHWVYDIGMYLPAESDVIRLLQGNVAVSPGVTEI